MDDGRTWKLVTSGNGLRYDYAVAAAVEIIGLYAGSPQPEAVLLGRIVFTILDAMNQAAEGWKVGRGRPGEGCPLCPAEHVSA
jgi:hypothetical protein